MILFLLTIGFISILGQVALLRELNVAFYGIELIYLLAMGVWMFWTALGALIGRRSFTPSAAVISWLLLLFALLLPLEVVLIRGARIVFGGIPGAYLPFLSQLVIILLALLPVGTLLGLLFQWAARSYIGHQRSLAMAYAIESAGGLLGGLAATLLLAAGSQNFAAVVLCSLLTSTVVLFSKTSGSAPARIAAICLAALFIAGLWFSSRLDFGMTRWNHPSLIETRDSPYSRISFTRQQGQIAVFENDVLGLETESTAAEEFVHLAAIQHDAPKQVLMLGGGVDGLVRELLKHRPRQIDYVELNPVLLELARQHLPADGWSFQDSDTVSIYVADPRAYLDGAGSYDLILVGMPDPSSGQANRFYTREFFESCSARLNPGGVLALRLKSSENIWTRFLTIRNTGIYRSVKSVFADAVVLPGVTNIFLAARDSLSRDPAELGGRFSRRGVATRMMTAAYINYLYSNDRFFEIADRLAGTNAPANTDTRPVCYRFSSLIWLSRFFPQLINWQADSGGWLPVILMFVVPVAAGLAALFLMARRQRRWRRTVLAGLAGFLGMVFETELILYYQVKSGVLFQNLGILLMLFMAGLAAGAMLVVRMTRPPVAGPGRLRKTGAGLLAGFALLNLMFMGILGSSYTAGLMVIGLLMLLTGSFVAGVFACVSLAGGGSQREVVSPLYAADLLGGCAGSLLGSLLLIPFLGMFPSAGIVAALSLLAIMIV